jgi:hypothetical protein
MNPGRLTLLATAFAAVVSLTACAVGSDGHSNLAAPAHDAGAIAHVLLLSVDGLHEEDVARCIAASTCPHIAALGGTGVRYTNASTPGLSDSFPGLAALLTGGTPRSAGLFYDVSYDRTLYAPGDAHCTGATGWNMVLNETVGIDAFNGGSAIHLDGGGDFNPQAIPYALVNDRCVPVYPHDYLQTNTLFEVVKAALPGARTAWADKHAWAYEWVNGPSGHGVDDLARTEISSVDPVTGHNYEDAYTHTEVFDDLHVRIVLNQIDGMTSTGADAAVPTVFGTNFQTLSVAQKAIHANGGGYVDAGFTPGAQVSAALQYVDTALGRIVAELREKQLAATTLIVLTAKHGQSASDHATLVKHGDTLTELLQAHGILDSNGRIGQAATVSHQPNDGTGLVGTGLVQTDDVGLIWLKNQSRTAEVVALLKANTGCTAEGICADGPHARILSGAALAEKFGDPMRGRAPDIIVLPNPGVLYSASKKKDADHGGDAPDDRHVALIVSLPSWAGRINAAPVATTQVAPTILAALKLDPTLLHAVKAERTPALPDITFP